MSDSSPFQATAHLAPSVPRCAECAEGVPTLFPSQNGTFRECAEGSCEVCRSPLSRRAARGTPAPTGLGRKAQIRVHPCHAPILAGLDGDSCALPVMVDPYPLTPAGEVWALTGGRITYLLRWGALDPRDVWSIPGHPPDHQHPVMAAHRCGDPVPPEHRLPPAPATALPAPEEF